MTAHDGGRLPPGGHSEMTERVLHVVEGYAGFHLVSPETIAAAIEAQLTAAASPRHVDFGELRRSGDTALLAERLEAWDISLDEYIDAIERSAGSAHSRSNPAERLAALHDVEFDGDDDANAPSDSTDLRSEWERENEVEDHYTHTLETRMCEDVPADILSAFDAIQSSMFVDYRSAVVEAARLDEMISALETRGFTVIRD